MSGYIPEELLYGYTSNNKGQSDMGAISVSSKNTFS